MGRVLQMAKGGLQTPPGAVLLGSIAEGSIVKLNENGSPVEFYVAQHNYEAALNGEGRTLLVRKECYDQRVWHTSNVNEYDASAIDSWLNGDYKALLDANAQSAIGSTEFYYTAGAVTTVTTLSRGVFLLSITELGLSYGIYNTEGVELPTASLLEIAYKDGVAVPQWTRSPRNNMSTYAGLVSADGAWGTQACSSTANWSRPCFTLPTTAAFDEETLLYKGVG